MVGHLAFSSPLCKAHGLLPRRFAGTGRRCEARSDSARTYNSCEDWSAYPDGTNRRAVLALLAAAPLAIAAQQGAAEASEVSFETYEDPDDKFTLSIPAEWTRAVPQEPYDRFRSGVSSRRTIAWFPSSGTDVNVTVVVTTPGADYTKLSSFGTASDFGNNLVQSMDRSYMMKGNAKMVDAAMVAELIQTSSNGATYFVEYTVKRGNEEGKHLFSRVALGTNGRYSRFFTVTATCPEARRGEVEDILKRTVDSLQVQLA